MITTSIDAWNRFEKYPIRKHSKDQDGDMYLDSRRGSWIYWYDFLKFMESNQAEEEHF